MDLSHPVHVDNCLLEPDTRQCWREQPAFIHRDLRCTNMKAEGKGREREHTHCCSSLNQINQFSVVINMLVWAEAVS